MTERSDTLSRDPSTSDEDHNAKPAETQERNAVATPAPRLPAYVMHA